MENIVDARGFSCPQPVIMAVNEMKKLGQGEITILVDTDTAKENINRATNAQGWAVLDVQPDQGGYKIKIAK